MKLNNASASKMPGRIFGSQMTENSSIYGGCLEADVKFKQEDYYD